MCKQPSCKWLAYGPRDSCNSYEGYDINSYTFYTEHQDKKSKVVQNCGVSMVASSREYASAKDKTPIDAKQSYYGIIQEIWELDYCYFTMPIFHASGRIIDVVCKGMSAVFL